MWEGKFVLLKYQKLIKKDVFAVETWRELENKFVTL